VGRAAIPQVILRNEVLGVLLPGGEPREWTIEVDKERQRIQTVGYEQFVMFHANLPKTVAIESSDGRTASVTLWEDAQNNRILIFSAETGLLRARGVLAGEPVTLSPGAYVMLSRFDPELEELGAEQLSKESLNKSLL